MSQPEQPEREMYDPDAPRELREALRSAQSAGPGAERLARMRAATLARAAQELATGSAASAGLAGAVGVGASAAGAGSGAASATSVVAPAAATWLGTWGGKLVLLGTLLGAGLGVWLWTSTSPQQAATPAPRATEPLPRVEPAPVIPSAPAEPVGEPAPVDDTPDPSAHATEPAEPAVEAAPQGEAPDEARQRAPGHTRRRAGVKRRRARPERSLGLQDEIALLSRAREALQDRPAQTLRLTAQHARDFPEGRFVQEREVLAVHALLRRGDRDGALRRGQHFLLEYPDSTHARRVAVLLEDAFP